VDNSILNHKGLLNFSSIDTLLAQFKYVSQEHDIRFKVYKKIITVMIESLENVWKYKDVYETFVADKEQYLPSFSLNMNAEAIRLITSNPIRNEDIEVLKRKIDIVNNKDREELKELYVETITNGKFSNKGGAGLGFIEMAKTSGNNLEYSFEPINDKYSLYTFIVTFNL
jgi:hypothetical protein